ncbi:L-glyceraldehyde 3-phosphate reductase [Flavobacterium rivuli WB 3.3-2 = DSM 21788]|uniref:L-glyceraldehyde 3-phosphate reductase n=1 Tax=Flavobacterium rivuli WB 3.3-2 = DSM 21788 TaxID=1121895 RepID=A0A0A2M8J8_9FLAO|nr:L-glyceraldehyde 3-phosphate reductase [Flavobacterium rivuli]KGO87961.1 L-glyceraldehyde 3-phosphate reductase [Flavobacterium rivuli WB 3.3-2 = DSM 21788]
MSYQPSPTRYQNIEYRRCGKSGLKLSALSLGLWHNFGFVNDFENSRNIIHTAFDSGITHFDLANNYGPPPGSAEEVFGKILHSDLQGYRDELIISTKAGYTMWDGPYGDWGSKKYLVSSLDQSLKRMKLDYVDIFYHHRPDPETPIEETMAALDLIVRQGKALYAGLSNYNAQDAQKAITILKELGTPCLIHQPKYSMFVRDPENGLLDVLGNNGVGCIPFSPLAQGLLTDKYLNGIPADSRVATSGVFLNESHITPERVEILKKLNGVALQRGQKLAHMALSWLLKDSRVTSVLIGASRPEQVTDSLQSLKNTAFSNEEINAIEAILKQ